MAHWADRYVGIAWRDGGRHDDAGGIAAGLDCWGLLRLVLERERGIVLPSFAGAYASAEERKATAALIAAGRDAAGFVTTCAPVPFDAVLLRAGLYASHVGLVVADAGGVAFLHVDRDRPAAIERASSPAWRRRIVGYYRMAGRG